MAFGVCVWWRQECGRPAGRGGTRVPSSLQPVLMLDGLLTDLNRN